MNGDELSTDSPITLDLFQQKGKYEASKKTLQSLKEIELLTVFRQDLRIYVQIEILEILEALNKYYNICFKGKDVNL